MSVLTRRAGSGAGAAAAAAAARRAYDELATVLAPLISQVGVEALLARALHVTRRNYPSDQAAEDRADPFAQVSLWLEQQDPTLATEAAAAMFATFAALLTTLIGEPLTTRYLRKAWPDGFPERSAEGTQA